MSEILCLYCQTGLVPVLFWLVAHAFVRSLMSHTQAGTGQPTSARCILSGFWKSEAATAISASSLEALVGSFSVISAQYAWNHHVLHLKVHQGTRTIDQCEVGSLFSEMVLSSK